MKITKLVSIYLVAYLIVAVSLFFFVKHRRETVFNSTTLETMLTSPSIYKGTVANPCQYYLKGEPRDFPDDYAKVILYCSPDISSANSLALPALTDHTVLGVIKTLGRIHGFSVDLSDGLSLGSLSSTGNFSWNCYSDLGSRQVPVALEHVIVPKEVIKCYYSDD